MMKRVLRHCLLLVLMLSTSGLLQAQTITSAASGNWSNAATWVGGVVPVSGNNVTIPFGHTVTLTSAVNTGTGILTVDGTLALAGFDMTAGALVGSGNIGSASGTPTLTVGSNNTNDIWGGVYSGTGARFTKVGTGSFFFAGGLSPNTYTGATTINAGRVQIATANERLSNSTDVFVASGAIFDLGGRTETVGSLAGAGTVTSAFNGGVLIVSGAANTTFSGVIQNGSGTVALTKAGTGTLTLTGANTYTGATNVSAGTLQLGGANERISNSSALTVAAGAFFDLNGFSETIGSLAGAGTVTSSVAGPATITHGSNSSSTFSGVIQNGSGTVALNKSGTGTLTLTGANTYTGATSITAGTLIAGNSTALGSGSSVSVSSGATLQTNTGLSLGSLSIGGVMNCNGVNSSCTQLILGGTTQIILGSYGSTASAATFRNNTYFTAASAGFVELLLLLPVTWLDFTGRAVLEKVLLNWKTASEQNNAGFDIERSTDGRTWSKIGFVPGKINSSTVTPYSYTDLSALKNVSYYRLKQVDLDGRFSYSRIVRINNANVGEIVISPNPVTDLMNVEINQRYRNQKMYITVTDMNGMVLVSRIVTHGNSAISTSGWPKGLYVVTLHSEDEIMMTRKILKQ